MSTNTATTSKCQIGPDKIFKILSLNSYSLPETSNLRFKGEMMEVPNVLKVKNMEIEVKEAWRNIFVNL